MSSQGRDSLVMYIDHVFSIPQRDLCARTVKRPCTAPCRSLSFPEFKNSNRRTLCLARVSCATFLEGSGLPHQNTSNVHIYRAILLLQHVLIHEQAFEAVAFPYTWHQAAANPSAPNSHEQALQITGPVTTLATTQLPGGIRPIYL